MAPDHFDALNLLGAAKAQLGRMGEAHRLLTAAVRINPQAPGGWANLGQVMLALKRGQEALDCVDKAQALAPDDIAIRYQRANTLLSLGRAEEALSDFRVVLARVPQHAEARLNGGIALAALGSMEEAVAAFDAALLLAPGHPSAHYNRGLALYHLGRYADALEAHDGVLSVAPGHAGAWLHRGRALAALNRHQEALGSYGKAEAIRKDDPDLAFSQALALLTLGDYRGGFTKYEARWRRSGMPAQRSRGRPLWLGEYALHRKTILVHAEQGLGDTIQFARYVPILANQGAKVVLEVQPELTALMATLQGGAQIIARGDALPAFDVHCPLGSLPLALKTEPSTVAADIPYLTANPSALEKWSARIDRLPRPRIAIAWSGNASHFNDRNRSIPFQQFQSLLPRAAASAPAAEQTAGRSFISIQRELRSDEAQILAGETNVLHLGSELESFVDTAAVIALCDLVISVDSAVAHLAGALGRPLWVLVPFAPDWRWTLSGESSPWYPNARLFRQTALGDWDGVIARVAAALRQLVPHSEARA